MSKGVLYVWRWYLELHFPNLENLVVQYTLPLEYNYLVSSGA
jgi:hypothetical protein